jgi:hypothetical protein
VNKFVLKLERTIPYNMDICYTVNMDDDQHIWRAWADSIQRWGVQQWVANFLESLGPLTILGAQIVYLVQPIFTQAYAENQLLAVARLLEDPHKTQSFAKLLRESPSP